MLEFCRDVFGHIGKQLDEKQNLISKFIMSSTGKKVVTTHIVPTTSRSKGNEAIMQFRQLIENNVGNIFPQKLCRK